MIAYVLAKFGEAGSTHPWESSVSSDPPLKLHAIDNSAVDYSISLKLCTEFKRMTVEVL